MKQKKTFRLQIDSLPSELQELQKPEVQSKAFELCGQDELHIVYYHFKLDLKPLCKTFARNMHPSGRMAKSLQLMPWLQFSPSMMGPLYPVLHQIV